MISKACAIETQSEEERNLVNDAVTQLKDGLSLLTAKLS